MRTRHARGRSLRVRRPARRTCPQRPPDPRRAIRRALALDRGLSCSPLALAGARLRARRHDRRQVGRAPRRRGRRTCSTPSSSSRSIRRSRRRCRRACRSTSCSSSSSRARAGTGSTRRCCRFRRQYRVVYNALTRQYRVSSGLLGQTFNALDEVERFLSRVTSRPVARVDRSPRHALRGRRAAAPRRQRSCRSRSRSTRSRRATGRCESDWYRWGFTP